MATVYLKRADQVPAIPVPGAFFDPDTDLPTVTSRIVQWSLAPDIITASQQAAGQVDMGFREGAPGGYGPCEGLGLIDVVAAGIRVKAGVAMIDSPRVLKALAGAAFSWVPNPNTIAVAGIIPYVDNQDNYCYLGRDKSLTKVAGSLALPGTPSVYLGLVTMLAGVGTIDGSGVLFRGWGGGWERITGDSGVPADSPPAGLRFLQRSRTAAGDHLFLWDGAAYRYQQPSGVTTPAQWTANQNDLNLPAITGVLRASTDASHNLTGIAGGVDGRILRIVNVGAQNLVLQNQNAGSAAANRVITGTGADVTIGADGAATLAYDLASARWRRLS